MSKINSYKDLLIWQRSIELVKDIYKITNKYPEKERYGLVSQLNRAVVSISANIAEGWGRDSKNSYLHFLKIARGSLFEVETLIIISAKLDYLDSDKSKIVLNEIEEISKMINSFINSINKSI